MADVAEGTLHRDFAAGRVEHDVEPLAAGRLADPLLRVLVRLDRSDRDPKTESKGEPVGVAVHERDLGAVQAGEYRGTEPDGAGPDDQCPRAWPEPRARHRMSPDGEEFDARRLVERQAACRIDVALRHADALAHAAVPVHAENFDPHAAI